MEAVQALAALVLLMLAVWCFWRMRLIGAILFISGAVLVSNARAAEVELTWSNPMRAAMGVAVVLDTDIPDSQETRALIARGVSLFAQTPIDITIKKTTSAHIADDTNPASLTAYVQRYHVAQVQPQGVGITLYLTRRPLAIGSKLYRGYANYGTAYSGGAAVVSLLDDGLDYQTIAHEVAHTLNVPHDGEGACEHEYAFGSIMNPYLGGSDYFSECSVRELKKFIDAYEFVFYPRPQAETFKHSNYGGAGAFEMWFAVALLIVTTLANIWRVSYWKKKHQQQTEATRVADAHRLLLNSQVVFLQTELKASRRILAEHVHHETLKRVASGADRNPYAAHIECKTVWGEIKGRPGIVVEIIVDWRALAQLYVRWGVAKPEGLNLGQDCVKMRAIS